MCQVWSVLGLLSLGQSLNVALRVGLTSGRRMQQWLLAYQPAPEHSEEASSVSVVEENLTLSSETQDTETASE